MSILLTLGLAGALLISRRSSSTFTLTVSGPSMSPALKHGQEVVLRRISSAEIDVARGDIVAVKMVDVTYLKRVIGLPGELIEVAPAGRVRVDGVDLDEPYAVYSEIPRAAGSWQITQDCLFLMGDQRQLAVDSRVWGCIPYNQVIGKITSP